MNGKPPFKLQGIDKAVMMKNLDPEDYKRVYEMNAEQAAQIAQLKEQLEWYDRRNQSLSDIGTILAVELFKARGLVSYNLLEAPGHGPVTINGPLVHRVTQTDINKIEHLYPGTRPAMGWSQEQGVDDTYLVLEIKSQEEALAGHAKDPTLN